MNKLPDKLSNVILLALKDLEEIEKNPEYTVDMSVYHFYDLETKVCSVCFAGAIMANQVGPGRRNECFVPHDFGWHDMKRYVSLDLLRKGEIGAALGNLDIAHPQSLREFHHVTEYHKHSELFKKDMREIATLLKEHGL